MEEKPALKRKLHHHTPSWVPDGSVFHIRIRCRQSQSVPLTNPTLGKALLDSVAIYHASHRWWCPLFLLMPDHLHALLAFPAEESMPRVVGEWKHFHARQNQVAWQEGYFDHRIRNGHQFAFKAGYTRQNPVVKHLCTNACDWPWVFNPDVQGGPCVPRAASEPESANLSRAERPTHL